MNPPNLSPSEVATSAFGSCLLFPIQHLTLAYKHSCCIIFTKAYCIGCYHKYICFGCLWILPELLLSCADVMWVLSWVLLMYFTLFRPCHQAKHTKHTFVFRGCSSAELYQLSLGPALPGHTWSSFASGFSSFVPAEQGCAVYNQEVIVVIQLVV